MHPKVSIFMGTQTLPICTPDLLYRLRPCTRAFAPQQTATGMAAVLN